MNIVARNTLKTLYTKLSILPSKPAKSPSPVTHQICNYLYSTKPTSRSYRKRVNKRAKLAAKPTLNQSKLDAAMSKLPARFTPEDLHNVLILEDDPLVCLALFNWSSTLIRFRHNVGTYHCVIKKLGAAGMYDEMDGVVNQVMAVKGLGNEGLFNTVIYYSTEARRLTRAVSVFKFMQGSRNLECRPSVRTYNLLFAAFLSRGKNSYVNHVFMETIRCLFRQMVGDGLEPDVFALNSMVKGYVLSLHVNDALRIFHQMETVYNCRPNTFTYDYLIHGLCAQGRTVNARELCDEMKGKGFVPSCKSYNSLVNALALGGEVEEAVGFLWEMVEKRGSADFITYKTLLDEMCRRGTMVEAMELLGQLEKKNLVDRFTCRKLQHVLEDDLGDSVDRNHFNSGRELR